MREAREEEDEKKTDLMRRRNEIEFFNLFFFGARENFIDERRTERKKI